MRYTHVSKLKIESIQSPLDKLRWWAAYFVFWVVQLAETGWFVKWETQKTKYSGIDNQRESI
jgi:hypothetical protein